MLSFYINLNGICVEDNPYLIVISSVLIVPWVSNKLKYYSIRYEYIVKR